MACPLLATKPISETTLTYGQLGIWEETWEKKYEWNKTIFVHIHETETIIGKIAAICLGLSDLNICYSVFATPNILLINIRHLIINYCQNDI